MSNDGPAGDGRAVADTGDPAVLADFLGARGDSIIERFCARVADTVAPTDLTKTEIRDHLPLFLKEVEKALREGSWPPGRIVARSKTAEAHGRQRSRVGYGLNALMREYGVLRDCIFERLEAEGVEPSLRELRILSDCISAAVADSVGLYLHDRSEDEGIERRHLLDLFQQAPGFVCFLRGPKLVVEIANAAYFQLVGHRDIIGKPVREALPEVEGQGFFELLDKVRTSGVPFVGRTLKVQLQREPGAPLSEAFIDLIYQPIRGDDGKVTGILTQGHDVTEANRQESKRKEVEAALRASEERYRTLFETIDDGFCVIQVIFDDDGQPIDYRFVEVNAAFEAQSGLEDAAGRTAREIVPGLDALWFHRYGRVVTTGEATRFESFAPAMDRWFDVYAMRTGDPAQRLVALVFKDTTERRRVEAERERLLALESAARGHAEEASRLKDEFLATVSHELRTPLTAVLGWVQMLRSGGLTPEKSDRALETVERNARAQAQLIEDLLDVSRILAGKLPLEIEALQVRAVIESALETVRPAAEAKGIRLQAALSSSSMVMGDARRLQQVVWNLLSNAVKFTPRGGRVQVTVETRDASVAITVADTGQGIAVDFQPYVFERFRQADGGSNRSHGGLGLGLAIVRQLSELHGGTVSVQSEGEGKGATFTVTLPAAAEHHDVAEIVSPHGIHCPPELAGVSVVVVEDEDDTREMLQALLEGCGLRVRAAASAAEAMRLFEAEVPDVLLSDIGMPEEDGYSFIQRVRKLAPLAGGDTPAVALTAYARTEDRTRALLSGFSSHVPKPVEPLELLAVITSLSRRRSTRAD